MADQGKNSNFQMLLDAYNWIEEDVIALIYSNLEEHEWTFVADVLGIYKRFLR